MPPAKRARAGTTADNDPTAHSTTNLTEILSLMTPAMHRKFLTEAATNHPEVMASLNKWNDKRLATINKQLDKELTTVVSFDHMIPKVIDLVDKAAAKDVSTSKSYDLAHSLLQKVEDNFPKVILKTTRPESLFETKQNAIEAVRDIFEICLVNSLNSMVGRIMRQNFHGFAEYLHTLLGMFSQEEMVRLMACVVTTYDNGSPRQVPWIEAFEKTAKEVRAYGLDEDDSMGTAKALEILSAARGVGVEGGVAGGSVEGGGGERFD